MQILKMYELVQCGKVRLDLMPKTAGKFEKSGFLAKCLREMKNFDGFSRPNYHTIVRFSPIGESRGIMPLLFEKGLFLQKLVQKV